MHKESVYFLGGGGGVDNDDYNKHINNLKYLPPTKLQQQHY